MKTANPGKKPSKLRQMFGSRFKAGSYSAFAAAVAIATAVLANLAVQALPQTATQIDLTAQSLYTLSDQTRRIAASLDTDVNLYLLALRGNEDDTISRLLQSYAELNSHIHVSNVDPTEQPTFLDTYDLDINQLYANSVLVDGGGRSRLVNQRHGNGRFYVDPPERGCAFRLPGKIGLRLPGQPHKHGSDHQRQAEPVRLLSVHKIPPILFYADATGKERK